jgi:RNA polymerase sigma-70 factor (ECF subfamily)
MNNEIQVLTEKCINGDRRAQETLFKMFHNQMSHMCSRYTQDPDSVQEIVQRGFIKVFTKLKIFDSESVLAAWIITTMKRTAIDYIRETKHTLKHIESGIENLPQHIEQIDEPAIKNELVIKAISELPERYRETFNLYVVGGYSHCEVANIMGIQEGTSKSNLFKAKLKLQNVLKEYFN